MMEFIADSGERREFGTGAVRDMASKGRCDLLPWDVIGKLYSHDPLISSFCECIGCAVHHDNLGRSIESALYNFIVIAYQGNSATALLDNAFHFEAGAKKYSNRNWENGIPVDVFLDSAGRHFLKWMRGDKDEHHDRAVVWNLLCALWTIDNKPEMIDAPTGGVE